MPVHLSVQAEQFFWLQTADLILHGGEYLLDLSNIHVLKDTLELISFMIQIHCSPHAAIHEYSPNRFVDREMELIVFRNRLIFLRKIPDNFLLKYPTRSAIGNVFQCQISSPNLWCTGSLPASLVRWPPPASLESGACHLRSKPMLQVSLGWKDLNFENKRPVSPGFIVQKLNLTAKATLVGATTTKLRACRDFATTQLPLCFSAFVAATWLSAHQFECLNGCERKEKRPLFFFGQRIWRSQQVSSGKKKEEETNLTIQRRIRRIKHVRKKKGEGAAHSAVSRHHKAKLKLQSIKKKRVHRATQRRESPSRCLLRDTRHTKTNQPGSPRTWRARWTSRTWSRHALSVGRIHRTSLRGPNLLECTEERQDRSSNPHRIPSRWWSHHLDTVEDGANAVNSLVVRSSIPWIMAVQHDVGGQVLADVNVVLRDAQERRVVEPAGLLTDKTKDDTRDRRQGRRR